MFDEVQTFPPKLLAPVKHVLKELTAHYGVNDAAVHGDAACALEGAREIVPDLARRVCGSGGALRDTDAGFGGAGESGKIWPNSCERMSR